MKGKVSMGLNHRSNLETGEPGVKVTKNQRPAKKMPETSNRKEGSPEGTAGSF